MNPTSTLAVGKFYGARDGRWQSELVTLTLLRHAEARAIPHHAHKHAYLTLLLEGGYREWADDDELVYGPLSLVFHPEGFAHHDEITIAGSRFFMVEIHPDLLGPDRLAEGMRTVRDLSGGAAVWATLRALEIVRSPHHRLDFEESVTEILHELLVPLSLAQPPPWLGPIEAHLRDELREPMSLGALASLAGVHPVHAARVFRAHHGCTMGTFRHRQRVLQASKMIAAGGSLAEVAIDCGFFDQSHMTHVFKSITGFAPVQLRKLVS
jgi:AraC family transcriptional regulator